MRRCLMFAAVVGHLALASYAGAQSAVPVIVGDWEGPGFVSVEGSERIFVQCRVKIKQKVEKIFRFDATCATKDMRIAQGGVIVQVKPTLYHGDVFNKEFGVRGQVTVRTEDVRQVVLIRAEKGAGRIVLSRREIATP